MQTLELLRTLNALTGAFEACAQLVEPRETQLTGFFPSFQLLFRSGGGSCWRGQRQFQREPSAGQGLLEARQIVLFGAFVVAIQGLQGRVARRDLAQLAQRSQAHLERVHGCQDGFALRRTQACQSQPSCCLCFHIFSGERLELALKASALAATLQRATSRLEHQRELLAHLPELLAQVREASHAFAFAQSLGSLQPSQRASQSDGQLLLTGLPAACAQRERQLAAG